jgi:hypothetical protein
MLYKKIFEFKIFLEHLKVEDKMATIDSKAVKVGLIDAEMNLGQVILFDFIFII